MDLMKVVEKEYEKTDIPSFAPGDLVRVHTKIVEGGKSRIQRFQGTVIMTKGDGLTKTFTVRKVTEGVGVERTFPIHSPNVSKIELLRKGKVRRAKILYLRERRGKAARIEEKR
jgi:large subunit ribosomal protein L19